MLEGDAEFFNVKFKSVSESTPHTYLIIVCQVFIYLTDKVFLWKVFADTMFQSGTVKVVVQHDSVCFQSVSACTPCLLEIGFNGVRTFHMQHQTDIGLVDAHAKGVGGNHHTLFPFLPLLLATVALGTVKSGMVVCGTYLVAAQQLGYILRFLSASDIDDG